jgi:hypothetical protein
VAGVPLGNGPVVEGTVGASPSTPDAASPWDPSPPPGAREPSTRPRP